MSSYDTLARKSSLAAEPPAAAPPQSVSAEVATEAGQDVGPIPSAPSVSDLTASGKPPQTASQMEADWGAGLVSPAKALVDQWIDAVKHQVTEATTGDKLRALIKKSFKSSVIKPVTGMLQGQLVRMGVESDKAQQLAGAFGAVLEFAANEAIDQQLTEPTDALWSPNAGNPLTAALLRIVAVVFANPTLDNLSASTEIAPHVKAQLTVSLGQLRSLGLKSASGQIDYQNGGMTLSAGAKSADGGEVEAFLGASYTGDNIRVQGTAVKKGDQVRVELGGTFGDTQAGASYDGRTIDVNVTSHVGQTLDVRGTFHDGPDGRSVIFGASKDLPHNALVDVQYDSRKDAFSVKYTKDLGGIGLSVSASTNGDVQTGVNVGF